MIGRGGNSWGISIGGGRFFCVSYGDAIAIAHTNVCTTGDGKYLLFWLQPHSRDARLRGLNQLRYRSSAWGTTLGLARLARTRQAQVCKAEQGSAGIQERRNETEAEVRWCGGVVVLAMCWLTFAKRVAFT